MNRLRGGILSGAVLLACLSATLLSALAVIGIRALTLPAPHTAPLVVHPASGEVAVPDTSAAATPGSATTPRVDVTAAAASTPAPTATTHHSVPLARVSSSPPVPATPPPPAAPPPGP